MGNVIDTKFDNILENDIALEHSKGVETIKDTLKNSENILKSFMYLKEMFSSAPVFNAIVKIDYIDNGDKQEIDISDEANLLTFKNNKDNNSEIYYNDNDKLVLYPYEQIDIPVFKDDTLKVTGTLNVIQVKYEVR